MSLATKFSARNEHVSRTSCLLKKGELMLPRICPAKSSPSSQFLAKHARQHFLTSAWKCNLLGVTCARPSRSSGFTRRNRGPRTRSLHRRVESARATRNSTTTGVMMFGWYHLTSTTAERNCLKWHLPATNKCIKGIQRV